MSDYLFIYVTCASQAEAGKIAASVVEQKLAACANIMAPHRAVFYWNDKISEEQEVAVIFKTRADLFEPLKKAVLALHSYDCPCIVALPITAGHGPFLDWIAAETK